MRLGALTAVVFLTACGASAPPPLTVAAAANLETVLPRLAQDFEAQTGITTTVSFGATRSLGQQIENGAPFDLFLSADAAEIDRLIEQGRISPASRKIYAQGVLALWSPSGKHASLADLQDAQLIAMAQPDFAPYGQAAKQALQAANLWETIEPKIVYAQNVRMARQFAQSGNADAALIALSLTQKLPGRTTPIPAPPLAQALGVIKSSPNPAAAQQFADWLTTPEAQTQFQSAGYQ